MLSVVLCLRKKSYARQLLLSATALAASERVVIGVTGSSLLKKKAGSALIGSVGERCVSVSSFVRAVRPDLRVDVVPIDDPVGPGIFECD